MLTAFSLWQFIVCAISTFKDEIQVRGIMYKILAAIALIAVMLTVFYLSTSQTAPSPVPPSISPETARQKTAPVAFSDWQDFTDPSGKFKAQLPSTPQFIKGSAEIPTSDRKRRYEIYASQELNGNLFMINVMTYPSDFDTSDIKETLRGIVDETVQSNPNNRLVNNQESLYQDRPALDFDIDNQQIKSQGRAFMIGKTVYILVYSAHQKNFVPAEYQKFVDSFAIQQSKRLSTDF
jgi:hypothetical protein